MHSKNHRFNGVSRDGAVLRWEASNTAARPCATNLGAVVPSHFEQDFRVSIGKDLIDFPDIVLRRTCIGVLRGAVFGARRRQQRKTANYMHASQNCGRSTSVRKLPSRPNTQIRQCTARTSTHTAVDITPQTTFATLLRAVPSRPCARVP